MSNIFSEFYKKSTLERLKTLFSNSYISKDEFEYLEKNEVLDEKIASQMIENHIGLMSIPVGVATNFLINGKEYVVPMATEEPSVIAAASNAASQFKKHGGFKVEIDKRLMIGHIAYYDVKNYDEAISKISENKNELINIANLSHEGINSIGGGAVDITIEKKEEFLVVYLYVNTLDAMGANIINTMLEAIKEPITQLISAKALMAIISNYQDFSMIEVTCSMPIEKEIGEKIQLATKFANADIKRSATNNKGVLNGISAVTLVTGNDTRAIEAALHTFACGKSLTNWRYEDGKIHGSMKIPMPIASVGGSIGLNKMSKIALNILNVKDAKELSTVIGAVGLAQNFAALKALVTTGIQKGHMKLHARSVAIFAGATGELVDVITQKMIENEKIDILFAKQYMEELKK